MSLSKKALMIGIGSTLAVGTVTTAIAVPLATQNNSSTSSISATPIKPATTIDALVDALKAEDIIVSNVVASEENNAATTPVDKTQTYAFNLKNSQFSLTQEAKSKFPSQVNLMLELETTKNTAVELNKGEVNVTVKALFDERSIKEKDIKLTGFKAINKELEKILKEENNKAVLDLTSSSDQTYKTIETLNENKTVTSGDPQTMTMQSGVTALLHTVTVTPKDPSLMVKNWSVEGTVKLEKIDGTGEKVNFYLVKGNGAEQLKLVSGEGNKKLEALIDEIKVNNLLATSISTKPVGINKEDNEAFLKAFKAGANEAGYKTTEESSKIELEIKQTPPGTGEAVSTITVNPSLVEKNQYQQEVKGNLVVSFGSGDNDKTYVTNDASQLKELTDAGFDFSLYVKKINKPNDKVLKVMDLSMNSELDKYFAKNNFTMPVVRTTLEMSSNPLGMFTKTPLKMDMLMADFKIGTAEAKMDDSRGTDVPIQSLLDENWISFVTYSYKGMTENNVLLTPNLDVIRLEVKKGMLASEVDPEVAAGRGVQA